MPQALPGPQRLVKLGGMQGGISAGGFCGCCEVVNDWGRKRDSSLLRGDDGLERGRAAKPRRGWVKDERRECADNCVKDAAVGCAGGGRLVHVVGAGLRG